MDYLVQFRSFELFLSLNPSTSIRSVEASFNIERPISGRLKFFNMIEKYLSENYSEHLLRVMIFYKCVKKILLKQEIKSSILLNIIENCRQFGAVGVMKQIKDPQSHSFMVRIINWKTLICCQIVFLGWFKCCLQWMGSGNWPFWWICRRGKDSIQLGYSSPLRA